MPDSQATSLPSSALGDRAWCTSDAGILGRFSLFLTGDADLARRVTVRVRAALADAASSPDNLAPSPDNLERDVDACAMRAVTRASWQAMRESCGARPDRPLLRLTATQQQVLFRRLVLGQSTERIATSLQRSPDDVRSLQRSALARLANGPSAARTPVAAEPVRRGA
jgi:DNA-directed RNA polymerase specialized sigma24 family protein